MYISVDFKGGNVDAFAELPYGCIKVETDLYYNPGNKLFYFYTWGDANGYRYKYISMRIKSIDCVSFTWSSNGQLMRALGKTLFDISYNDYGIVSKINKLYVRFDNHGNLLKHSIYLSQVM